MKKIIILIALLLVTAAAVAVLIIVPETAVKVTAGIAAATALSVFLAYLLIKSSDNRVRAKDTIIKVSGLYKRYSSKADYSVEDINLIGFGGEIIGILGHNGAGKSTTIKCITGMHPYEQGKVNICGYDLKHHSIEAKANFGYVSDEFTLFEKMTGYEFISFMANVYKVPKKEREARIEEFQEIFALGDSIYKPISSYSHGMKQKISFMGALIHEPKVFILDEPMVGLDPYTANQVKRFFIRHAARGNIVLFSSHNLDVVEKLCDRVYIIDQGHILEELDLEDFRMRGGNLEEYFLNVTHKVAKV